MNYKYKRGQIFGKRLKVPRAVLSRVYACKLSFQDYVEYDLFDKIPTSCMIKPDRDIFEKFGVEKCKGLDWELINHYFMDVNVSDILLSIDPDTKDINHVLYERLKDKIKPSSYPPSMKKLYADRLVEVTEENEERYGSVIYYFNEGKAPLSMIVKYWFLFKDKDLSYCLSHDEGNEGHITDEMLKDFMSNYGGLAPLVVEHGDIYTFIKEINLFKTPEERHVYVQQFTDYLLSNTKRKYDDTRPPLRFTDDEFREIFKYSSLEEYLRKYDEYGAGRLVEELKDLPEDYIFNNSIPFSELLSYDVLHFVGTFGLKNVADFDDECGQFFTKNNFEMLKLMYDMYLHYAGNEWDTMRNIYCNKDGNYVSGPFSKDDFYESMRRMIIFGPSDWNYNDKAPDYRAITGEFRTRFSELFISEEAPEELQHLFYTKSITPQLLIEHPEYIDYLRNKDLSSCFIAKYFRVFDDDMNGANHYENMYSFISSRTNFDDAINFILQYGDIIDITFDSRRPNYYRYETKFSGSDSFEQMRSRINATFREMVIKEGIVYPSNIPSKLVEEYPSMFLDKDAPKELQEAFYSRTLSPEDLLLNPSYRDYVKDIDLEVLFKRMPVNMKNPDVDDSFFGNRYKIINFIKALEQTFGKEDALDIMISYGKYIIQGFEIDKLENFVYDEDFSKNDFLDEIDKIIYKYIIDGRMKYDENMVHHFKKNYPSLFLDLDVSQEIKDKFYSRKFTLQDFLDNPELLDIFCSTNVICGLSEKLAWIIPLFNDLGDSKESNDNRLKVVEAYSKIENEKLKKSFIKYVKKYGEKINIENIENISEVFSRLEFSNSIELSSFSEQLAIQLLESDDPLANLGKIERVFLENNTPLCGKMFLCFQILYPNMSQVYKFNFNSSSRIAPSLKDESLPKVGFHATNDEKRLIIIFNDLLRVAYRSNERSFNEYLTNLENGNKIYYLLQNNGFDLSSISEKEKEILTIFASHLEVLYDNTKAGKEENIDLSELSLEEKLKVLSEKFHETKRYDLKDRIVRQFCYTAGIKSFEELKELCATSRKEQRQRTERNLQEMEENGGVFKIQEGDFVRGIGYYDTLGSSLNAGNYCKEQLGVFNGTSDHDTTPLDVDLTLVTNSESLYNAIKGTPTGFGFGNVYIIIKKDNPNISISRDKDGNLTGAPYDPRQIELFGTHVKTSGYQTHWGARTGISLADVDFILYKEKRTINDSQPYDENGNVNYLEEKNPDVKDDLQAIKFEIAKNGYYIPVVDFSGKLIFTREEFKELRDKMQGLSYFGETHYELSEHLITPEVEKIASKLTQEASEDTKEKRAIINGIIKEVLDEMGIALKCKADRNLNPNSAEFIDTGSTGRGTNIPYDGDFDFFMRLDAEIMKNPKRLRAFKDKIIRKLKDHHGTFVETGNGDIRCKKVQIDEKKSVDIDISFGVKTNKVQYSSDVCLRDRLSTIKKLYPDQYDYVVANIILAKKVLKNPEVHAYKPRRSDDSQGGLGGIGVETWIVQNGGSFVQACQTFLAAAVDENGNTVPFDEFKSKYPLWDFGDNHFAARKGFYLHDNFVECNMNQSGYERTIEALQGYMKSLDKTYVDTDVKNR